MINSFAQVGARGACEGERNGGRGASYDVTVVVMEPACWPRGVVGGGFWGWVKRPWTVSSADLPCGGGCASVCSRVAARPPALITNRLSARSPARPPQILAQRERIHTDTGRMVSLRLAAMVLAINKVGRVASGQGSFMSG